MTIVGVYLLQVVIGHLLVVAVDHVSKAWGVFGKVGFRLLVDANDSQRVMLVDAGNLTDDRFVVQALIVENDA